MTCPSTRPFVLPLLLALIGCQGRPQRRADLEPAATYGRIANNIPDFSLGVSEPPAIIGMTRSAKLPPAPDPQSLAVFCNEQLFRVRLNTLVTRVYDVPYSAIVAIEYEYEYFPNILYCIVLPFIQGWKTRLVLDANKVPLLRAQILADIATLRGIAREVRLPAPYFYAAELEDRLQDMAATWGQDRLELRCSRSSLVPPFIPYPGESRTLAEAFEWARTQPESGAPVTAPN